jgi:3-hydroxyisobutyrate dehydrogenase-like beta-hydroxyacid dehydrogenase
MQSLKIGFIGLGEMGRPMALNLLKKGFEVTTCSHLKKEAAMEIEHFGGKIACFPEEVANVSEVIIIMVRDTRQTDEVVYGQGFWEGKGVWQGLKPGSVMVISSTISPGYCRNLAEAGKGRGIEVLDAPVSGGHPAATAGTLTFMIGGQRKAFDTCHPVFEAMGRNIHYLGGSGSGLALKLINNYMMIVNAFGTSEAILLGLKCGLNLRQMLEIIRKSSGNSTIIENWDMLAAHQQESARHEAFVDSIFYKDVSLAVDFAAEMGVKVDLGKLILGLDDSRLFREEPYH